MNKIFLMLLGVFCSLAVHSQVWSGSAPLYYNPSFAGSTQAPRISFVSRIASYNKNHVKSYNNLTADLFIPAIGTGIGFTADFDTFKGNYSYIVEDFEGVLTRKSNTFSAGLAIAPKISIKGRYTISPGFEFDYYQERGLNTGPGQVNANPSDDEKQYKNKSYTGYRGSILFNTRKFYAGITFNAFSRKTIAINDRYYKDYYGIIINPPRYYAMVQSGFTIQNSDKSNFSITPQVNFSILPDVDFMELDITFRFKKTLFGPVINKTDAIGLMVGRQSDKIKIMVINSLIPITDIIYNTKISYCGMICVRYIPDKGKNSKKDNF